MSDDINPIEVIEVDSVDSYLKATNGRLQRWRDVGPVRAWFRGVTDANHKLQPSFFRFQPKSGRFGEDGLRDAFMRRAYPLLQHRPPTDHWEWYFLMQHYDLPTRLLDWTESSLIALFFAAFPYPELKAGKIQSMADVIDEKKKAAVWMMDPGKLNQLSLYPEGSIDFDWPVLRHDNSYVVPYLSDRPGKYDAYENLSPHPLAISPPCTNPRLAAQRGMFVLFGFDGVPLEERDYKWDSRLLKFEIPATSIRDIRADLRRAGIIPSVIFPELSMLGTDIIQGWVE